MWGTILYNKAGVPGGLVGGPRANQCQFRVFKSHRVHARRYFLSSIKKWLAESARAWASYIRWKSTSSGNAEPYLYSMRDKKNARTGGKKGRHLWPRHAQKIAEGKPSYELGWKVK